MFTPKYERLAAENEHAVFMAVYGDCSSEMRLLMKDLQIRSTPTYLVIWKGRVVHRFTGIQKEKLLDALAMDFDSAWERASDEGGAQVLGLQTAPHRG
jgi:thioredoxin-like negative regulator of GroEL